MHSDSKTSTSKASGRGTPLLARKIDFRSLKHASAMSLGTRYLGRVLIDCKFRFSESRWGVLGSSKSPAGIIYVDLCFHQPDKYNLASASVQISLKEYEPMPWRRRIKGETAQSRLAVTDGFGPKRLLGHPTAEVGRTAYNFTPSIDVMGATVGGMGINKEKLYTYSSQWVLNGYPVAQDDDGIVYRTLRWDLTENHLASDPDHSNVFHAGLAFTHDSQPFCIQVQIDGKLRKLSHRVRFRFPPKLRGDQGTTATLLELGAAERQSDTSLDALARDLERSMEHQNISTLPAAPPPLLPDKRGEETRDGTASSLATHMDSLHRASAVDILSAATLPLRPDTHTTSAAPVLPKAPTSTTDSSQGSMDKSSTTMTDSQSSLDKAPTSTADSSQGSLDKDSSVAESEVRQSSISVVRSREMRIDDVSMLEDRARRLAEYPTMVMFFHMLTMFLDFFGPRKRKLEAGSPYPM